MVKKLSQWKRKACWCRMTLQETRLFSKCHSLRRKQWKPQKGALVKRRTSICQENVEKRKNQIGASSWEKRKIAFTFEGWSVGVMQSVGDICGSPSEACLPKRICYAFWRRSIFKTVFLPAKLRALYIFLAVMHSQSELPSYKFQIGRQGNAFLQLGSLNGWALAQNGSQASKRINYFRARWVGLPFRLLVNGQWAIKMATQFCVYKSGHF